MYVTTYVTNSDSRHDDVVSADLSATTSSRLVLDPNSPVVVIWHWQYLTAVSLSGASLAGGIWERKAMRVDTHHFFLFLYFLSM